MDNQLSVAISTKDVTEALSLLGQIDPASPLQWVVDTYTNLGDKDARVIAAYIDTVSQFTALPPVSLSTVVEFVYESAFSKRVSEAQKALLLPDYLSRTTVNHSIQTLAQILAGTPQTLARVLLCIPVDDESTWNKLLQYGLLQDRLGQKSVGLAIDLDSDTPAFLKRLAEEGSAAVARASPVIIDQLQEGVFDQAKLLAALENIEPRGLVLLAQKTRKEKGVDWKYPRLASALHAAARNFRPTEDESILDEIVQEAIIKPDENCLIAVDPIASALADYLNRCREAVGDQAIDRKLRFVLENAADETIKVLSLKHLHTAHPEVTLGRHLDDDSGKQCLSCLADIHQAAMLLASLTQEHSHRLFWEAVTGDDWCLMALWKYALRLGACFTSPTAEMLVTLFRRHAFPVNDLMYLRQDIRIHGKDDIHLVKYVGYLIFCEPERMSSILRDPM